MRRLSVLLLLLLLLPAACFCAPERIEGTIIPAVLLNRIPDTDYVYISVLAKTGPANESNSTGGFSALIASLLLTETRNRSAGEMEEIFYRLNGSMNVSTTPDATEIRLLCARKNLSGAMRILGDCLSSPKFTPESVKKARENAFEGMAREADTPLGRAYDRLRFSLYGSSPYKRSMYGSATAVGKATPKQLYSFFNEGFCPARLVLSVTGNVTAAELKKLIDTSFFRSFPSPERRGIHKYNETVKESGREYVRNETDGQTYCLLGFLAPAADEEDWAPMTVISGILGSGKSGRLFRELRQKEGFCYSVGCRYPSLLRQSHIFLYASTAQAGEDRLSELMLALIEDLKTKPVTREEIDRAAKYIVTQEEIDRENPANLARLTAFEELYGTLDDKARRLAQVTPEAVMECANKYFTRYKEVVCKP